MTLGTFVENRTQNAAFADGLRAFRFLWNQKRALSLCFIVRLYRKTASHFSGRCSRENDDGARIGMTSFAGGGLLACSSLQPRCWWPQRFRPRPSKAICRPSFQLIEPDIGPDHTTRPRDHSAVCGPGDPGDGHLLTRFIIALSFLRAGLGLPSTPANLVLISLALFMTLFTMAPTFDKSWESGVKPFMDNKLSEEEAFHKISDPFRDFMTANVRQKDIDLFAAMSQTQNTAIHRKRRRCAL